MNRNRINFKKITPVTTFFVLINTLVFIFMTFKGGTTNISNLIKWGAVANPLIREGQFYRLITAQFIHIGLSHFLMNMLFLYLIGTDVEKLYGSFKFFIIYLASGVMGNLLNFGIREKAVSAGASTSLYGLLGVFIGFMVFHKNSHYLKNMGKTYKGIVIANIVYSFIVPNISITGHLGGFIGGFLLSGIFDVTNLKHNRDYENINIIVKIVCFLSLLFLTYILLNKGLDYSLFGKIKDFTHGIK